MSRWIPAFAFDRPVTVAMAFLAALVLGVISWVRIPVQMMPAGFEPSFLWVWVSWPDGSPRESDDRIVAPIQAQLATVPGIKHLNSNASEGSANLEIEFAGGVDMDQAYNDVVDRLERAQPDLPSDIGRYGVWKYNPADEPIIWAGVSFPEDGADAHYIMTKIVQPRLERLSGVAAIDVWGTNQRNLEVHWNRESLFAHGVDLGDVQRRMAADNFQRPAGRLNDRGLIRNARSLSKFEGPENLASYPVKEGVAVRDIAQVGYLARRSGNINRIDGKDGAAFALRKESSANTVETARAVRETLDALGKDPRVQGAKFHIFFDQGDLIEDSLDTLVDSALYGGALSVLILWIFLREWRMTLLISAGIPFSLLTTVAILYLRGESLNLLSLMGLMLAVGMVVDNGIVVIETIYRRRAEGASLREAAVSGTAEVNLAITLSTMTTMVVFLPVILMSEDATFSFFMGVLGLPVVFALGASLVVALVFTPASTRLVAHVTIPEDPRWLRWLSETYASGVAWVLRRRFDAGLVGFGMLVLTVMIPLQGVSCSGGGEGNLDDFVVRFTVPKQASLSERVEIVEQFEAVVQENRARWGVRTFRAQLRDTDTSGRLFVYLGEEGELSREAVMEEALAKMPQDLPGVRPSIGWEGGSSSQENSIRLAVHGEDMTTLEGLAEEVVRRVEASGAVLGAQIDLEASGADEVRLVVRREELTRYGFTASTVGQTVAFAMRSNRLNPIFDGTREVDVITTFSLEDRDDLETLRDFGLWSPVLQEIVPIRAVTDVVFAKGPGTIRREDRRTSVGIAVDLKEGTDAMTGYAEVEAALADMALPRGYSWSKGDQFYGQMEDDAARNQALLLSVAFVFLLMGVLFESFLLPMCIITTIPMAAMGAFWGLWLTDTPMDVMAGVGLVILVGVIVNNGIVLVDQVEQLRKEGRSREEALTEAARRRLRPILMTALTTIVGLIPMATGTSTFVGIPYAPLGRTVMSGMIVGTGLTLFFVPWLYTVLDDLRDGSRRALAITRGPVAATAAALLLVMLPGVARAERPLSLSDALTSAMSNHPTLVRARLSVDSAQAQATSALAPFDPNYTANANFRRSSQKGFFQGFPFDSQSRAWDVSQGLNATLPTGTSVRLNSSLDRNYSSFTTQFAPGTATENIQDTFTTNVDVSLTQQLLEGHRRSYNLRNVTRAREGLVLAELQAEKARQDVYAQTSALYWGWVYAHRAETIAVDAAGVAGEALRVGQLRLAAGEIAPLEVTRLDTARVQAEQAALDARLAARKAADDLLLAMGEPPGQDVLPAAGEIAVAPSTLTFEEALPVALAQNLDLAIARAQRDAAQTALTEAKHGRLPSLSATAAAGLGSQDSTLQGSLSGITDDDAFPFVSVSGQLSVPIGNRAARGDIDRAVLTVSQRDSEVAEAEAKLRADLSRVVAQLAAAEKKVALADANLRLATETRSSEEALADTGRKIQKDVLEARRAETQAKADAAKARTDYRQAQVEVERLLGTLGGE